MIERQIEAEFYKVSYSTDDGRKEILVGNSSDSSYTIMDIIKQVKEWLVYNEINDSFIIVGIEELDSHGFCIFRDKA